MSDKFSNSWDERYSREEYVYGIQPNEYLKEQLQKFQQGKILFAAEGEGRNAVYAAALGWDVSAFDISTEGKKKALQLAQNNNVEINYSVGQLPDLGYQPESFDAIALVYAHFPANIKAQYHQLLDSYLKSGGIIIFEAFSKNHLAYKNENPKVGGPNDLDMLFSLEEIQKDFNNYEIIELEEKAIELHEGLFHNGTGSVIRFTGKKK